MKKKSVITLVVAFLLALVMAAQMPMTAFAAAVPQFISELLIVSATDANQAKSKLGIGYEVLSEPLYEGTHKADGKEVTTKTFLAYKITTDPENAIVDIKAMSMYGGYSYGEYAALLESQRAMTQQLVDGLKDAIIEFRDNYNDDKPGAVYAEEMLRYFYYDDLDMTISELFLDYDVNSGDDAALVTLFMQGNVDIIENIENLLMIACSETGESTFLEILDKKANEVSKIDYKKPTFTNYSENITDLLNTLMYVQYPIQFYNKCEEENPFTKEIRTEFERQQEEINALISADPDLGNETAINQIRVKYADSDAGKALNKYESYIEALTPEQYTFMNQGQLYSDILKLTKYPGLYTDGNPGTLYDLIMAHDVTDEKERVKYSVTDFDELMQALTPGQRGLLKVGFAQLLSSVIPDKEYYAENLSIMRGDELSDEEYEKNKDDVLPYQEDIQISVFEGVDRTLYDADGIALTSEALTLKSRNENANMGGGILSEKTQKILGYTAAACSGVALITTTYLIAATISQRTAMNASMEALVRSLMTREFEVEYTVQSYFLDKVVVKAQLEQMTKGAEHAGAGAIRKVQEKAVGKAANELAVATRQSTSAAVKKATATPLRAAFSRVLSRAIGMVLFIIDIACLVEMVIELIVFLVKLVIKLTTDAPYQAIPRVLCSAETVYNGHLNGDGERIYEDDYVFYYGVKNPEIDTTKTDPSGNLKKYAIADIYDWSLTGADREWIAVYTTKDRRMGNPIKAGSLNISGNDIETGKQVMKYFHSEQSCDTMYYYQTEKRDFVGIADKFVHFTTATDAEMKMFNNNNDIGKTIDIGIKGGDIGNGDIVQKESDSADGKSLAFGCGGLAIGAVGGAVVTSFVKKKKTN